ncbi:MAG: 50S ribosomal protein L6 [Pseudomonadales bacterium]|nr:50S ribosomal protein L6 [Pseudomonadales bacterium]
MSRIGRTPIAIPQGVTVTVSSDVAVVKSSKGELSVVIPEGIKVAVEADTVTVTRANEEKHTKSLHGLVRSLLNNSIIGVTDGFKKTLKLVGTGYRAKAAGQGVELSVGYSHPVLIKAPQGVTLQVEGQDTIYISGYDKQKVGQLAAEIRKVRPPEPYKGKGIRYEDEVVRRKQGKAAA